MQKITPFLWFDNQAEEAVTFYTAIFKNSKGGKFSATVKKQPKYRTAADWWDQC